MIYVAKLLNVILDAFKRCVQNVYNFQPKQIIYCEKQIIRSKVLTAGIARNEFVCARMYTHVPLIRDKQHEPNDIRV